MSEVCDECYNKNVDNRPILCGHCFEEVNLNKYLCMSCIVHNHANTFIDNRYYVLCKTCYAKYHEE